MKQTLLLFVALFVATVGIQAQVTHSSAKDDATQDTHPCKIVIKGSYETSCPYIVDKYSLDEYPNTLVACKGSRVTYHAYAYTGDATVTSYTWSVIGDVSHTVSADEVVVDCVSNDWG